MAAPSVALVLHGRLGSWLHAASDLPGQRRVEANGRVSNATADDELAERRRYRSASSSHAAIRAFARFTHSSLWRHVVEANRRAGARVRVVVHSWSPEVGDVLDALYKPAASLHEPVIPTLNKVVSQHLSMQRALKLLDGLREPPDDLIMVARLDLLLFTDVPLASLAATQRARRGDANGGRALLAAPSSADVLYLPHTCVPSRLRLPAWQWAHESTVLQRTCSGSTDGRVPKGRRMVPSQLSRYAGQQPPKLPEHDFTHFVLDYWFIASPPVAASFAGLADALPEATAALRTKFSKRRGPPMWSHVYWAQHVLSSLLPSGVALRFMLLHETDFNLARFWRFGADCLTKASRRATDADGGGASSDGGGDVAWQAFANATLAGRAERGDGGRALAASPLAQQCPATLESGSHILCPWFSKACAARAADTLAYAEGAGRFQSSANLPPRQLMGAERCVTPACIGYQGTARKRRAGEQKQVENRG